MAQDEDEEAERQRRAWAAHRKQKYADDQTMVIIGAALLFVVTPGLFLWLFWGYLQLGSWPTMTAFSLFHWYIATQMVGFNNIANWFLNQWIGWYPAALGALCIRAGTQTAAYY